MLQKGFILVAQTHAHRTHGTLSLLLCSLVLVFVQLTSHQQFNMQTPSNTSFAFCHLYGSDVQGKITVYCNNCNICTANVCVNG